MDELQVLRRTFLTSCLALDDWLASIPDRFTPRHTAATPTEVGAWKALQPVWSLWRKRTIVLLPGIHPRFLGHPARCQASIPTALSLLPFLL